MSENKMIELLIRMELKSANEKFPPFASTHEGWAVLFEEVAETNKEIEDINDIAMVLFEDIMKSHAYDELKADRVSDIRHSAVKGIEELIQVAAMCDKFKALGEANSMKELYEKYDNRLKRDVLEVFNKNYKAKIVPNDTEPCCEVTPSKYDTGSILSMGTLKPCKETKEYLERASDFIDAVCSGLDHTEPEIVKFFNGVAEKANQTMETLKTEHKCGNCNSYNWTPVSEHAVCMNPKNQKTETKATWSCPEWEKGEKE